MVKGQNVDSGVMGPQVGKSRGNPKHDVNFVEGSSRKSAPAHVSSAMQGHSSSKANHPACSVADGAANNRSRKNQAGAHGPNIERGGKAMPHSDVATAPGRVLGKTVRKSTTGVKGPNTQFQGAGW